MVLKISPFFFFLDEESGCFQWFAFANCDMINILTHILWCTRAPCIDFRWIWFQLSVAAKYTLPKLSGLKQPPFHCTLQCCAPGIWGRVQLQEASVPHGTDWGHTMGSLWVGLPGGLVGMAGRWSTSLSLLCGSLRGLRKVLWGVVRLVIWWLRSPGLSMLARKAEAMWPLRSPHIASTELTECKSHRLTQISGDGTLTSPLSENECQAIFSHSFFFFFFFFFLGPHQ